jgi:hypothetical protein
LGQGKIVEDVIEADFVLAGDRDTEKYAAPPVTWPAFIGMIPGNEQLMRK